MEGLGAQFVGLEGVSRAGFKGWCTGRFGSTDARP